ncbi:MAG: protein-L-isoaspartate(D-aspartate) O-methyltransferase [Alphaproteobacteria bacterium]|nr:protein-L-isoaspartate(D-aspartate) O-methyltransferase [Alphaproteobacteria bacterium]
MELRRQGVTDADVLSAIETTPRELFVPKIFEDRAYENCALPIEAGQTISQPYIVAFMTEALKLSPKHRVLEIGTGSGYQTAILSKLAKRVFTIERYASLMRLAEARFRELRLPNVDTMVGDGALGWPSQAPFDRIIITAAVSKNPPQALLNQLSVKGLMVIPIDLGVDGQVLVRVKRTSQGFQSTNLLPVRFVPLLEGVASE